MFFVVLVIGFLASIAGNEVRLQQTLVKTRSSTHPNKTKHIETKDRNSDDVRGAAPLTFEGVFPRSDAGRSDEGRRSDVAGRLRRTASLSALYLDRRKADIFKDLEILFDHPKPHKILNSGRLNRLRMQARAWRDDALIRSKEEFKNAAALSTVATTATLSNEEEEEDGRRNKNGEKQTTTTTTTCRRHFLAPSNRHHVTRRANRYVVRRRLRMGRFSGRRGRRAAGEGDSGAKTLTFSSVPTLMAANDEWEVGDVGHRTRRKQRTTTMGVYFTRVQAEIFIQKQQISKKVTEKTSKTQGMIIALLVIVVVAIIIIIVIGAIKKRKKKPVEAPKGDEKQPLIPPPGTTGVPPTSQVPGATAPTTTTTTKAPAEQQPTLMLGMVTTSAPAATATAGTSGPPPPPALPAVPSSMQPATAAPPPATTALPPLSPSASSPASPHPRAPPTQPTATSTTSAPPSMVSRAPGAPRPIPASKGALALASKLSIAKPPVPLARKAPSSSVPPASPTKR